MTHIAPFEGRKIRTVWDEARETWLFSVVDAIAVLTDSPNPTDYLKKMRKRDNILGDYLGTNCPQIDMMTETGKMRKTLAANPKQLLRIIQSIPSKKAEPFKLWLAQIHKNKKVEGLEQSKIVAKQGAGVAKTARIATEKLTGKPVVNSKNAKLLGNVKQE